MLRNYLKIAWRNLLRSKSFSAINIFGLSVGMACCMLLLLYIRSELSYDQYHRDGANLFLLGSVHSAGRDAGNASSSISAPYAFALKQEFPEVEQVSRLWVNLLEDKALLQVRQAGKPVVSFYETKGYQVDSTFFELFRYEFLEGDARSALDKPNALVLSEDVARKLFGRTNALHRVVKISGTTGNGGDFEVTGVYRDPSERSHIDAHFFVPLYAGWLGGFLRQSKLDFGSNNMFTTYVRLRPGSDPARLQAKFPAFLDKYARADLKAMGFQRQLFLAPVPGLHLDERFQGVVTPTNSRTYLYILGTIALFTLLIACVNFMNLSTARSAKRAAEVGLRKVMGAERHALVRQFLGESMLLTLLALVLAWGLVALLLPVFNSLADKYLSAQELFEPRIALLFTGLALLTGLVAGSYPAFYLAGFNPVRVLKGTFTNSLSAVALRKGLVVFQFVVSVGLVLATFIIQKQMRFLREKPLGFTQDQQVAIPFRSAESRKIYPAFRSEILRNPQVLGAAGTQYYPGIINPSDFTLYRSDQTVDQGVNVRTNWVDYEYLQTMGFKLLKGRLFSRQFPADTNNHLIVNEATLRKMGIAPENAVGQRLLFDWQGRTIPHEIVGVVRDFHFEDLHQPIQPYAFLLNGRQDFNYILVHVGTANARPVLQFLEETWKALRPDEPFEFTFLNEDFQKNYKAEARTSRIVGYFTAISILISCLGLFGLAAFAAQQRTKEIGVRKVLGASVLSLVALLSKDFLKLVLVGILIASPLAWWAMNRWLQEFAYRVTIPWWVFGLAAGLAIVIAFVTVSFQSVKAALMNPVKSLRTE
jgi:putative ABC transport system permease protein